MRHSISEPERGQARPIDRDPGLTRRSSKARIKTGCGRDAEHVVATDQMPSYASAPRGRGRSSCWWSSVALPVLGWRKQPCPNRTSSVTTCARTYATPLGHYQRRYCETPRSCACRWRKPRRTHCQRSCVTLRGRSRAFWIGLSMRIARRSSVPMRHGSIGWSVRGSFWLHDLKKQFPHADGWRNVSNPL